MNTNESGMVSEIIRTVIACVVNAVLESMNTRMMIGSIAHGSVKTFMKLLDTISDAIIEKKATNENGRIELLRLSR